MQTKGNCGNKEDLGLTGGCFRGRDGGIDKGEFEDLQDYTGMFGVRIGAGK